MLACTVLVSTFSCCSDGFLWHAGMVARFGVEDADVVHEKCLVELDGAVGDDAGQCVGVYTIS